MSAVNLFPAPFLEAWNKADPTSRFRYRMNNRLAVLVLASPAVLWGYFIFTAVRVGFTWPLLAFVAVYLVYTGWLVGVLMKWRAFCVRSAIVITSARLLWTHHGEIFEARWVDIDPRKLGLDKLQSSRQLEASLQLRTVDGQTRPLWLYRIYGFMDQLESFLQQFLERSSRGQITMGKKSVQGVPGQPPARPQIPGSRGPSPRQGGARPGRPKLVKRRPSS